MADLIVAVVRFQAPGFHCWPHAPAERAYLRESHRHLFHVEVRLELLHAEREVEFHDLLDFCKGSFGSGDFGSSSCERLAVQLLNAVRSHFTILTAQRKARVSVFEDGEVGAIVGDL